MILRRTLLITLSLLVLVALLQVLYWAPQLPGTVAAHFDGADRVNGWMERTTFLMLVVGVELLVGGLFVALPFLIDRMPDALINLPDKEYFLAPARRQATLAHTASGLMAVGCATLLMLLVLFQSVFALNAGLARDGGATLPDPAPMLSYPLPFGAIIGAYLLAVAGSLAWLLLRFRKPAAAR